MRKSSPTILYVSLLLIVLSGCCATSRNSTELPSSGNDASSWNILSGLYDSKYQLGSPIEDFEMAVPLYEQQSYENYELLRFGEPTQIQWDLIFKDGSLYFVSMGGGDALRLPEAGIPREELDQLNEQFDLFYDGGTREIDLSQPIEYPHRK